MTSEQVPTGRASTAFIDGLFKLMCQQGASDLHLAVGLPPMVRKDGHMQPLDPAAKGFKNSNQLIVNEVVAI